MFGPLFLFGVGMQEILVLALIVLLLFGGKKGDTYYRLNDYTGIKEAIYLRDNHNIFPIIIPKKYGAKDFSELYSLYRINQIHKFVKETLTIVLENYEDNEHFGTKEIYDSLPY